MYINKNQIWLPGAPGALGPGVPGAPGSWDHGPRGLGPTKKNPVLGLVCITRFVSRILDANKIKIHSYEKKDTSMYIFYT